MQDKMREIAEITLTPSEAGTRKFFKEHPRYERWVKKALQSKVVKKELGKVEKNFSKEVANKVKKKLEKRIKVKLILLHLEYYFEKGKILTEKEMARKIRIETLSEYCFLEELLLGNIFN